MLLRQEKIRLMDDASDAMDDFRANMKDMHELHMKVVCRHSDNILGPKMFKMRVRRSRDRNDE